MAGGKLRTGRARGWTVLIVAAWAVSAGAVRAQGVGLGLESGWAGIENFAPVNGSFGLALFTPVADRWTAQFTYTQWTGEDGNYSETFARQDYLFYGNRSLTGGLLYRLVGDRGASWLLGVGMGLYHMFRGVEGEREHAARIAPTATSLIHVPVSPATAVYLRGDLGLRWAIFPNWGFVRLGIAWWP